jgi:hypothetical protein
MTSGMANAASGFLSLNSALSMIPGLGAGAAAGIAGLATAILALGPVIQEIHDKATVSNEERL